MRNRARSATATGTRLSEERTSVPCRSRDDRGCSFFLLAFLSEAPQGTRLKQRSGTGFIQRLIHIFWYASLSLKRLPIDAAVSLG